VLIQSGFAVKLLSETEAAEVLEIWISIRELDDEPSQIVDEETLN